MLFSDQRPKMSDDPLVQLKEAVTKGHTPVLYSDAEVVSISENIATATHIKVLDNSTPAALSTETRFVRAEPSTPLPIGAIYFCWVHRDKTLTEYIAACSDAGVINLTFLERVDLLAWLEGAPTSEHIGETISRSDVTNML